MSVSRVIYSDVAPHAAEKSVYTTDAAGASSDVTVLSDGLSLSRKITLEGNYWPLDGSMEFDEGEPRAFESVEISDENGEFANAPVITVTFPEQYTSVGLTLRFDSATGAYCTGVHIAWYQGGAMLTEADFTPDSVEYFCEKLVEHYDKIIITITNTGYPYRRARLEKIAFGIVRTFGMSELKSVRIINEMNIAALELPVSTMDWGFITKKNETLLFQEMQTVEAYNGDALIGVYYTREAKRSSKTVYSVTCEDEIGILDLSNFSGAVYTGYSAMQLVRDIVGEMFPVVFEDVEDTTLTGILETQTRREALQQVLFAWGVCLATDGMDGLRVFSLPEFAYPIDENSIYLGTKTETASTVTELRLEWHRYTQSDSGSVTIDGVKYADETGEIVVQNPNTTANTKQNVVTVTGCTLVSEDIAQTVAQRVYDYYQLRNTNSVRIVWGGERLGDKIITPTAWLTDVTGNISRMDITLSNTVAAGCETKGAG